MMTKTMISTKQHICKAIYTIVNSLLIMYITSVLKQFGPRGPLMHHFVYFRLFDLSFLQSFWFLEWIVEVACHRSA